MPVSHRVACAVTGVVIAFGSAAAQPAEPPAPEPPPAEPPAPEPEPTVRPENARGWEQPPAESRLLVLGPIGRGLGVGAGFLVTVLTSPFRGAAWLEDHYRAFSRVRNFFYNDARTAGVLPTVAFESGFGGNIGATAFHHDLFGHHEQVSASGSYGGSDRHAVQAKFELPELFCGHAYASGRGRYEAANNLLFTGIGNPMDGGAFAPNGETRYGERRTLVTASAGFQHVVPRVRFRLGATYIFNDRDLDQDVASTSRPIGDAYDVAMLTGFVDGIRLHEVTGDLDLDVHDPDDPTRVGVRLSGFAGRATGGDAGFSHWGAELTGYVTPWRAGRVFLLRVAHEGVAGHDIPFTDLPRLGGPGLLRGYRRDEFRDELTAIGTLEYRYPIHHYVSGTLFVETGKVARTYDALTSGGTDNWHLGFGGGLIVHSRDSISFTFQLAYGDSVQIIATTDVWQAFRRRGREL